MTEPAATQAAGAEGEGARHPRRRVYGTAIILLVALTCYRAIVPVFRGELLDYLAIDDGRFGLLFSLANWALLAPLLAAGWLNARLGSLRLFRLGILLAAAGMGLVAASGRAWTALAGALAVLGAGTVLMEIGGNSLLLGLYAEQRRRVFSLGMAARSVTETVAPALGEGWLALAAAVPAVTFGWVFHAPFAALAAVFVTGFFLFRPRTPVPAPPPWKWRDLLIGGPSLGLVGLLALHGAADLMLFTWMARYLGSGAFDAQPVPPGFVLSAFSIAYVVSRTILGRLPETWGRRRLLVAPGLIGGTVAVAGILSRDYMLTACGYVAGAFFWSAEYPAMVSRIAEREGARFGAALALMALAGTAASAAALWGSGWLIQAVGVEGMWVPMAASAALFPVVGLGGALWIRVCEGRPAPRA